MTLSVVRTTILSSRFPDVTKRFHLSFSEIYGNDVISKTGNRKVKCFFLKLLNWRNPFSGITAPYENSDSTLITISPELLVSMKNALLDLITRMETISSAINVETESRMFASLRLKM